MATTTTRKATTAAAILAGVVALSACGGVAAPHGASTPHLATTTNRVVHETLYINANGPRGWPQYSASTLKVPAGATVDLTIISNDNGTSPPSGPFAHAQGIIGEERVDGRATVVNPQQIAHTFTVPALGLNIVVPAAPNNGTVRVEASFKVPKAGEYRWQCMAPCGTGETGWGGPMATEGFMAGTLEVN